MLAEALAQSRGAILERWIESVIVGYPEDTARFLRRQADRFANPVGASLREGLAGVLDGVLAGADPGALEPALDRVIRVRAVQGLSPAVAVGFVFELKRLLREGLGGGQAGSAADLAEIESSVDRTALIAFEVYMRCREQLWAIRNAEVKNLSVGIMERVAEWRARREAGEDAKQNQ
jgi:hypothetical protein